MQNERVWPKVNVRRNGIDKIRQNNVNSPKKSIRVAVCRVSFVIVSVYTRQTVVAGILVSKLVLLMDCSQHFGEFYRYRFFWH